VLESALFKFKMTSFLNLKLSTPHICQPSNSYIDPMEKPPARKRISVVIPAYKVKRHILQVIEKIRISGSVSKIFVVDDCCPDKSGEFVRQNCTDGRVSVIFNLTNLGVGGAVMTGYRAAIADGSDVIIKIDGDGQMNPALIPAFIEPILCGEADYTKGNRFYEVETVRQMPLVRLIGNAGLSFLTKLSSGYWNLFDPTNGFTAINADVAARLPFKKISNRYFFESDMLFRLNIMRAVVVDIPMFAEYGNEESNLKVSRELPYFFFFNMRNLCKRLAYSYFIRNFNYATLELMLGIVLFGFGMIFGGFSWIEHHREATLASAGTVMLAALPIIMGLQLLLGFINYDMVSMPSSPLSLRLHADARHIAIDIQHTLND
jgi:dolichol-phosphate mannosyltransferase